MTRHAAATAFLVCVSVGLSSWAAPGAARAEMDEEPCAAWPGEIDPLPRVDSADPISARWARQRAEALTADARLVETMSLQEARRYWQHVLCLDPYSDAGRAGMFRTGPFRVSGPMEVDPSGPPPVSAAPRVGRAAEPLDPQGAPATSAIREPSPGRVEPPSQVGFTSKPAPVPTAEERALQADPGSFESNPHADFVPVPGVPTQPAGGEPSLSSVDQELSEIETLVAEAHFHTALSIAASTRALLVSSARTPAVDLRRARLEVLAATAAVALGRDQDALVSMSDALRANPQLQLDTATTSPKVVAILDEARRDPRPARNPGPPSDYTGSSADIGTVQ